MFDNLLFVFLKNVMFKIIDSQLRREGGGGRLPNIGRYGCAASAKPSSSKISPKKPNVCSKSAQKPNNRASFRELWSAKTGIFHQVKFTFLTLLSNITHFLSKIAKNPMPRQNLPPKT